ncbi:MAG: PEP-CTERM sorting domain-containing protein [Prosthecobacter sp.]
MNVSYSKPGLLAGALAFALFMPHLSTRAAVTITDSFTGSGNSALNGDAVGFSSSGSHTWTAAGPNGGGYYSDGSVVRAGVPGNDLTAPTTRLAWVNQGLGSDQRAVLSLDSTLVNNVTPVAWTSVSFLNNPLGTGDSAEWNTGQMSLRLQNDGEWWVLGLNKAQGGGNQEQDTLAHGIAGSAPGFTMGGTNNLRLDFDNATNLLSAYINGVQVLAPTNPFAGIYPSNGGYEPTITASGFHMYQGDNQGSTADNFSLVITDAVPEPGRFVLLGLGGSVLILRRRRRAAGM